MMQKQFITPKIFLLAGVIAITVLFVFSTEVIADKSKILLVPPPSVAKKINKTIILPGRDKPLCMEVDRRTRCEVRVDCKTKRNRIPGTPIADVLGIPANARIHVPGQACATFDYDNGKENTAWRCSDGWCWP